MSKERLASYYKAKLKFMQCSRDILETKQFRRTENKRIGKWVQQANVNPIETNKARDGDSSITQGWTQGKNIKHNQERYFSILK
jgi:hypothetical protein